MKLNPKTKALLALAGMALMTSAAQAANVTAPRTNYNADNGTNGDLILVIAGNNTGGTPVDLEFDLGLASTTFTNASSVVNLSTTVLASTIASTFGAGWFSDTTLTWGVVGTVNSTLSGNAIIWATSPTTTARTSAPLQNNTTGQLQLSENNIHGIYSNLNNDPNVNGAAPHGAAVVLQTNAASYTLEEGSSNNAFGLGTIDGQLAGTGAQVLDLYQLSGAAGSGNGLLLGTFSITNSGNTVSFTPVPEPSTYAMVGLGAIAILFLARRKSQLNLVS